MPHMLALASRYGHKLNAFLYVFLSTNKAELQMDQTLLLDRRSIDLSGAREKEGHFHYKNFLRASK